MSQKVLITGGAGFIGSHLVQAYLEAGFAVVVVDKKAKPEIFSGTEIKYYQQDITVAGVEDIFDIEKPQIVNHHAALINVARSFKDTLSYTSTNVLATIKLLELAKKYQIRQFIFASSVAVYGNTKDLPIKETQPTQPESFYGLDKLLAEYYLSLYKPYFKTMIFRYANVYGPRQTASAEGGVVAIFCQSIAKNKPIFIYGSGEQTRDFVYAGDVAQANILASQQQTEGVMHVSTGTKTSINQLFQKLAKIAGFSQSAIYQVQREGDILDSVLDNSVIKQKLGWQVGTELDTGLCQTYDYFNNL